MLGSALMTAVSLRFTSPRHPLRPRHDPGQRGMPMLDPSLVTPIARRRHADLAVVRGTSACRIIAAARPPRPRRRRRISWNIAAKEPDTLDPHTSVPSDRTQAMMQLHVPGARRGCAIKDGKVTTAEVEPDLAESWTLSPDGTVWTVQAQEGRAVPQGLRRADGRGREVQLRAADESGTPGTRFGVNLEVIKSIEVETDPAHGADSAQGPSTRSSSCAWWATSRGYIVSKKAVEKFGDQYKWNPVRTGPFYFERHAPRERVVLKAFDKYQGGRPQIDEVHWFDVPEDATKLIGLEKVLFDLLYPEAVTADFADQVKKMGARHRPAGPGRSGAFLHQHDEAALRRHPRPEGVHARHRQEGHQGDHVSRRPGAGWRTAVCLPATSAISRWSSPSTIPELAKKLLAEAGHPNGFTIKNYFISKSPLNPQGAHPRPGTAQEGRDHRGATGRRARDLPREHQEEPGSLRALRWHAHHRCRPQAVPVLRQRKEIPYLAPTGNKGTNFAHYRAIDDLLVRREGRVGREQPRLDLRSRSSVAEAGPGVPADTVTCRASGRGTLGG